MTNRSSLVLVLLALVAMLASGSIYRVVETERAVKLRFGKFVDADIPVGLHFKLPIAEEVRKFDARILTLDAPPESYYTVQKKRLDVDSFAKWRVVDVGVYYKATGGDERVAKSRLADRVNNGLRNEFGVRTLHEVVSGERDQLMEQLTESLNKQVQAELGIEVIDVRVKRIDFPREVSSRVYDRMRTDREKEARQYRSEGRELAEKIRADADREKVVIEANAYRESEQIRGDGDAKAASVYAQAYNQDREFYDFSRSLTAYKAAFDNKGDILLVDPENDFFKYLNSAKGKSK